MGLAGKYGQLLNAAARNPSRAVTASALGAGLLGATGSIVGNLTDQEQGEGPLRILSEAANAGISAALPGALTGVYGASLGKMRQPGMQRQAIKTTGSAANARKAAQAMATAGAVSAAAVPAAAGLGGLMGGGSANLYNAMGVPGFQPGINPESYGSSNMQPI